MKLEQQTMFMTEHEAESIEKVPNNRSYITTEEQLKELQTRLLEEPEWVFDTETTSLDPFTLNMVGISFYLPKADWRVYVPVGHTGKDAEAIPQLTVGTVMEYLRPAFESESIIICHHIKFDLKVMRKYGIDFGIKYKKHQLADTMLVSWLVDENRTSHGLKDLEETVLGVPSVDLTKEEKKNMALVPIYRGGEYAMADSYYTYQLWKLEHPKLVEEKLERVFWRKEMPYTIVLAYMEERGVPFDLEHINRIDEMVTEQLRRDVKEIYSAVGFEFNIGSGDQLGKVLFEHLKLPHQGKTKTGKYKTNKDVIDKVAKLHPVGNAIANWKKFEKVKSTYIEGLRERIKPDGRIHAQFNQAGNEEGEGGTVTGRLSSSQPNLQNQPAGYVVRSNVGELERAYWQSRHIAPIWDGDHWVLDWKIRDCYTAGNPETHTLIVADYSQIELRILAHFSQDPVMIDAYNKGQDLHARTASEMFGVTYEDIMEAKAADDKGEANTEQIRLLKMRDAAKAINFGIVYGQQAKSLGERQGISEKEAQAYLDAYMARYIGVGDFIERTKRTALQYGFVRTLSGRKRRLPEIYSPQWFEKARAERQSVNTRIQGSAGDLISLAQIKLDSVLPEYGAGQLIQVHDELIILSRLDLAEETKKAVVDTMENTLALRVPIVADAKSVFRWGQAK